MIPLAELADCCPLCGVGPVPPETTTTHPESVTGHYKCPKCRHPWWCNWLLSALKEAA